MPEITMAPICPPENYIWTVAAKKISYAIAKTVVAFVSSVAVETALAKYGVHVDPVVMTGSLTTVIYALLEAAHDYAKVKLGISWL